MIKICKYFLNPFKKFPMLRDTRTAFSLPVEHALHDTTDPHWARTLNGYGSMTSAPMNTIYGTHDTALVYMWRTSHQNMKHQSSLRKSVITGGSEKAAWVWLPNWCDWIFTRGQFWPSGIVVACVCVSVCPCVRVCVSITGLSAG